MDHGEDGSVASIMPYEEWNNITLEDINKGIVIVDNSITYTDEVPDFNEYVWIPIPENSNFARIAWTIGSSTTPQTLAEESAVDAYWEDTTTEEYTKMVASIEYYKGFYIGRYEASDNGNGIAQSKRGVSPWISLETVTTAITACANNTTTKNMHLPYGIEWDSILNWLIGNATISSSTTGETKEMELEDIQTNNNILWGWLTGYRSQRYAPFDTGFDENFKANNIYDLSGNAWELTQEKYSTDNSFVKRGGGAEYRSASGVEAEKDPVAIRSTLDTYLGFRVSFFITLE